jgi:hypothetical protein
MKTFSLRLEFLKNALLQLSLLNKIIISILISAILVPLCLSLNYDICAIVLLLILCAWIFNSPNQARVFCKVVIGLLIIGMAYFIILNSTFFRGIDDIWQVPALASHEHSFNILAAWNGADTEGRFMPLYTTKNQILAMSFPYGHTAPANYFLNSLLFAILILIMALILDFKSKQKVSHLYLKLFLLISMPFIFNSMFPIFSGIALSELEVILFSTLFLFFYKKINEQEHLIASQTDRQTPIINRDSLNGAPFAKRADGGIEWVTKCGQRKLWIGFAILCAVLATYSKESAFSMFLIIGLINFFFNFKMMEKEDKIFNFSLILNAVLFLVLYYFLSYSVAINVYMGAGSNFLDISILKRLSPFLEDPILIIIVIFCFFRVYFVLFKKDRKHIFYDGILFAATGIIIAYELLGMFAWNYFAQAIVIFIPVISFWLCNFYDNKKYFLVGILCLFMAFLSFANISKTKVIFKAAYSSGYTAVYNILKIDRFSSSGHTIYIHPTKVAFGEWHFLINTLEYVNGRFFETKYEDETENKSRKTWFVQDLTILESPDKDGIYLFPNSDLSDINKNVNEFIKIAKWYVMYIYVHKDRL